MTEITIKKNKINDDIARLVEESEENEAKRKALKEKEIQLNLKQKEVERQTNLEEHRKRAKNNYKALHGLEKDYPQCPHFLGQIKAFNHRWDAWIKATEQPEILEFNEEKALLSNITREYKKCMGILINEVKNDVLSFQLKDKLWKKSIEKRLNKLEGKGA